MEEAAADVAASSAGGAERPAKPIGKAYFDHNLCLPWAEKTPCIRCEEMCPTPEKAIKILRTLTIEGKDGRPVEIQQPYVDRDLCVGCGICEYVCPVKAVEVWPASSRRRPPNAVPTLDVPGGGV